MAVHENDVLEIPAEIKKCHFLKLKKRRSAF